MNFKYELGLSAKCIITGFKGVIVGRSQYITGCDQYCLQAKSKDGSKGQAVWFDENAIQTMKVKKLKIKTDEISGGPSQWEPTK